MLLLDEKQKNEIFTQIELDPEATFKILKPLGEGAYGAVFKAQDRRDDQMIALKVMRFDPEECQDLLSEIRILRDCNNDFIVNFKDTFHKDGNIWLAMEFCEGGSALDIVKVTKHTFTERQCQCVLYHALQGLAYLHSKKLIHRDIKAANILINKDGRAKLADFGVAKSVRASGAGTTIGSPYWMAPEVLGTEKYDDSADIWSLGIAAIEMAVGKPPLSNYKPLQAMFMIPKNEAPSIPEEYIDDFSSGFIDFIAKCLTKNPEARPTALQLLEDPWICKVGEAGTVEQELMPWIAKVMPLIEKDRDLKARMANASFEESKWSDYTASLHRLSRGGSLMGGTMVKNALGDTLTGNGDTLNASTLKVVPDDAEHDYDDEDSYFAPGGTLVKRRSHTLSNERSISAADVSAEEQSLGEPRDSVGTGTGTMVVRKSRVSLDSVISLKIGALPDDHEHSSEHSHDHDIQPPTAFTATSPIPASEDEVYDSNTMKVNHTKDLSEDYGDFGAHHAKHSSVNTMVSEDHSNFNGDTMLTVKVKDIDSDEEEEEDPDRSSIRGAEEDELNEYHENAFSPSSRVTAKTHATIHSGNTVINHIIMTTHVTPGGPGNNDRNNKSNVPGTGNMVNANCIEIADGIDHRNINLAAVDSRERSENCVDGGAPPGRRIHHNKGHRKASRSRSGRGGGGGGYSIGGSCSFVDGTMVRHHSLDEDEEDCFQGQTMMYAPAMGALGSPRPVQSDDEEEFSEETSLDTTRTGRTGITGPLSRVPTTTMTKCASTSSKSKNPAHVPDRAAAMSDTITQENVYEMTNGYANKPSSPMSNILKTAQISSPRGASHINSTATSPHGFTSTETSPQSETPQPGTAGVMSVTVPLEANRVPIQARSGRNATAPQGTDVPTSPIPPYNQFQGLTNHYERGQHVVGINEEDGAITVKGGHFVAPSGSASVTIEQYSILANQLDFSKLSNKASLIEHLMLNVGVLSTWVFIVSYITLECSEVKQERELQLFLFSTCIAVLFNLIANPFYFKRFAKKYIPTNSQQLFEKAQPVPTGKLPLSVDDEDDDTNNHNQLAYHDGSDDQGADRDVNGANPSEIAYSVLIWLARLCALAAALTLSYYIYRDLSQFKYTDFTRYCIVLLTLTLFVGNIPLMGHYMLYFHRLFLTYYLVGWVTVFSAEFAYFHMVRFVQEEYFAAFITVNCIFFVFHIVATTWSCYVLKHRTLFMIDPHRFPNSHHFRFYFNVDGRIHDLSSVSTEYISSAIALSSQQSDLSALTPATTTSASSSTHGTSVSVAGATYMPPFRTIPCCCHKLICDSHAMLRFQAYASALSLWSYLGVMYTKGFEYVVFSSTIFILVNTVWNPLFYSRTVREIEHHVKCCCSLRKWIYYLLLFMAYLIGFFVNMAWCGFSISAFILQGAAQTDSDYATLINIGLFVIVFMVYFLPSIGYSFYRIPIAFGMANLFGALFCFFIPILISFEPHNELSIAGGQIIEDWFFVYTRAIIGDDDELPTYLPFIICAVVFSLYLTFSGASCMAYRLRKTLTEQISGYSRREFPMNMLMFWSFLASFAVLTSNTLWVFGNNFGARDNEHYDTLSFIAKLVYGVTICVQCSSLLHSIYTLKQKFDENPSLTAYLSQLMDQTRKSCGFCLYLITFPLIYASYLIGIILLSLCLGVTKLLAIRQVREFWLSLLIEKFDPNTSEERYSLAPAAYSRAANFDDEENQNGNRIMPSFYRLPTHSVVSRPSAASSSRAGQNIVAVNDEDTDDVRQPAMSIVRRHPGEVSRDIYPPTSPHTDAFRNDSPRNDVRRRMSSSVSQSVHMKVFKCCSCCTPSWMSSLFIDESIYNSYLMSELIVESLPLLLLNLVNMFFLSDRITTVSIVQAVCSALFLVYSWAKTAYYVRFHEWNLAKFLELE